MKNSTLKPVKIILLTLFASFFITSSFAQDNPPEQKSEFWKNVRFGIGGGIGAGNGFFSASLTPSAVYQFDKTFALGFGLNGTFNKRKNVSKSTIVGGSVMGLFNPIQEIQLSAEFEQLNVSQKFEGTFSNNPDVNYWVPALFVGAGYRTNNITFGIRYDLLYDTAKSVYPNAWVPFVRVFF